MTPNQIKHYENLGFQPFEKGDVGLFLTTKGCLLVRPYQWEKWYIIRNSFGGTSTNTITEDELSGCLVKRLPFPEIEIPPCPEE